jgi:hypothetical protein
MVFKATSNNISIILWWSVLLVEETGVSGETDKKFLSVYLVVDSREIKSEILVGPPMAVIV